ncbi:MAG: DUF2281 domain-containing protein [Bacteroidetes bacterium]|nr:MAG: DUF2281 domain-containing protein [Bacteroidota bacterium]
MTDIQLYTKLSGLPFNLKSQVADFIDFLKYRTVEKAAKHEKRIAGKAKGLIKMMDNFDEPIDGFKEYM